MTCSSCGAGLGWVVREDGSEVALEVAPVLVVHASGLTPSELRAFRDYPYLPILYRVSRSRADRVELFGGRLVPDDAFPKQPRIKGWRVHADVCPARPS